MKGGDPQGRDRVGGGDYVSLDVNARANDTFNSIPTRNKKITSSTNVQKCNSVVIIIRQMLLCLSAFLTAYLIQWIVWYSIMQHEIWQNQCRVKHSYYGRGTEVALFTAINILTEMKVDWMIGDGTLLGFSRNQKTIPWDNDADLHVISLDRTEEELYKAIEMKFTKAVPLSECHLVVGGLLHCGHDIPNERRGYVDIFYLSVDKDTHIITTYHSSVDYLNGLHIRYVLPLRQLYWKAYDMHIPVANKYEVLLGKEYGNNYATPRCAIKTCTHNYESGRMSDLKIQQYFDLYLRCSILICVIAFCGLSLALFKYQWMVRKHFIVPMDKGIYAILSKLRMV